MIIVKEGKPDIKTATCLHMPVRLLCSLTHDQVWCADSLYLQII